MTRIEKDLLKAVKMLIGEQKEALPGNAAWRLATIAEEVERKSLGQRSTEERVMRKDEIFNKLKAVIKLLE